MERNTNIKQSPARKDQMVFTRESLRIKQVQRQVFSKRKQTNKQKEQNKTKEKELTPKRHN